MAIEFDLTTPDFTTNIKVIGVGGAGGNVVNTMIEEGIDGVEFIVANTDIKDLRKSKSKIRIQIGENLTRGCGTGADPNKGRAAAVESEGKLVNAIDGADILIITAGFGGGTGTGAAPVIAQYAKNKGILTLAVVTKPFQFENKGRLKNFEEGFEEIKKYVDSIIVIPNDKICSLDENGSVFSVFKQADLVIYNAVKAISDVINKNGYIQVDLADVKTVISGQGNRAIVGTATCEGENRGKNALEKAIANPLMGDVKLKNCSSILVNVACGDKVRYTEFIEILTMINEKSGGDNNTIPGLVEDNSMGESISVTVLASGIRDEANSKGGQASVVHIKNYEIGGRETDELINLQQSGKTSHNQRANVNDLLSSNKEETRKPSFMEKFRT